MKTGSSFMKLIAKAAFVCAMLVTVFLISGAGQAVMAAGVVPLPPIYPCPGPGIPQLGFNAGFRPGATGGPSSDITATYPFECKYYEFYKAFNEGILRGLQFTVMFAILDTAAVVVQRMSETFAKWILTGANGSPQFYTKDFRGFLKDVGNELLNREADALNQSIFKDQLGWDLCHALNFNVKLGAGLSGKLLRIPQPECTFDTIVDNFDQSYQNLQPSTLAKTVRSGISFGGNDVNIAITGNQKILQNFLDVKEGNVLTRLEGQGLKPLRDTISGNFKAPSAVARDSLMQTNMIKEIQDTGSLNTLALSLGALQTGAETLPRVAANAFLVTFLQAGMAKLAEWINGGQADETVNLVSLTLPEADPTAETGPGGTAAERRSNIIAAFYNDVFRPNLSTNDDTDFITLLSTCNTPRGLWGCSMDTGFANGLHAAVGNGAFTVARAAGLKADSKTQYLHPEWELVPEWEAQQNQDTDCYKHSYCSPNLAKLRFARILPSGWELAANSVYNKKSGGRYVTLGTVLDGFYNCNDQGQVDSTHPWCKLINPNWVLTAPPFKCQVTGFTNAVQGSGNAHQRVQECTDATSCLKRDDAGKCVGSYGYCAAEKTVWRFGGDSCDEKYASCRTYVKPSKSLGSIGSSIAIGTTGGELVSYVRNTIDYGACTADNAGCMMYATVHDVVTTSTDRWIGSIDANWKVQGPRVYFDKTVKTCDAANEGCTKVYALALGQSSLNLVKNGSFEDATKDAPPVYDGWLSPFGQMKAFDPASGPASFDGGTAIVPLGNNSSYRQAVDMRPLRNYVLSFYARTDTANATASVAVYFFQPDTGKDNFTLDGVVYSNITDNKKYYASSNCQQSSGYVTAGAGAFINQGWTRYTCEFVSPENVVKAEINVAGVNSGIDAVELEEGDAATPYISGTNTALQADHLKIAPEEYACQGGAAKDRAECANFARVCQQVEAGCQAYREVGGSSAGEIPANLSKTDFCPASCVGYAEYRKLPSSFDLVQSTNAKLNDPNDDTVVNFIPATGVQCTADAAGCEEFTNVEAQSTGGEQKAYFTYTRACEKPSDATKTFFTWEGSDITGFQLRTWSLIGTDTGTPGSYQPKILEKAGPDGILKDPASCTEQAWKLGADLDCRQLYDQNGNAYYRFFSQTIDSNASCTDYRVAKSNADDCAKTGGAFLNDSKQCIYHVLAAASNACAPGFAGCRGYRGTTGQNTKSIINDTFANASSSAGFAAVAPGKLEFSKEALLVGDYSLKYTVTGNPSGQGFNAKFVSATGGLYMVTFWAKSPTPNPPPSVVMVEQNANQLPFGLTPDWKRFEVGPFVASKTGANLVAFKGMPSNTFIDEVRVDQLQDVSYVVRGSWKTPLQCDQTPEGAPLPQAMLGCKQYSDRKNRQVTVRQFNNLCKFEVVGCSAYVDSRNSDNAYAQSFVVKGTPAVQPNTGGRMYDNIFSGSVTTTRPADRYVYVIDEPAAHCDATQASCRAFGKPVFNSQNKLGPETGLATTANSFENIYLIDDINQYMKNAEPDVMCRPTELFCDTFQSGKTVSYFRDPQSHVCEYRDKVQLKGASFAGSATQPAYSYPDGQYSGWFSQKSGLPCAPNLLSGANVFLMDFPFSSDYQGWTALCPKDQSECTEFRDSNDHSDPAHTVGKPYYFINNNRIDQQTCNGKVDPTNGCSLIRDMSDGTLTANSKATYAFAHAQNDTVVSPIDCQKDTTNKYCKEAGVCTNVTCEGFGCNASVVKDMLYKSCTIDANCASNVLFADVKGTCQQNDSNLVVHVRLDRDCQEWFGCKSGETVYDDSQQKYVDICTNYDLCDQAGGASQGAFCSHYVDRSKNQPLPKKITDPHYEPVLRAGTFFNDQSYSLRPTNFSDAEYGGYSIPNRYQISDMTTRRVGYEILIDQNPNRAKDFTDDYRLVAGISIPDRASTIIDPAYPKLHLCQDDTNKQIGYYNIGEKPAKCYLVIDSPLTQVVSDVNGGAKGSPRNAQAIATILEQDKNSPQSIFMNTVMPGAECKAYPAIDSPFSNQFVSEWDTTVQPNRVKAYVKGYEGVAHCEKGEDCSCQYTKVSYGGKDTALTANAKYFAVNSQNAPPQGICVGGDQDGAACIPDSKQNVDPNNPTVQTVNEVCGQSGSCSPLGGSSLVRGLSGYCLQHDVAEVLGKEGLYQCLTWHPQPVSFGSKDVYHYSPTVGYTPPLNSGEYYCAAFVGKGKEGITLNDAKTGLQPAGQSGGLIYDERCMNGNYKEPIVGGWTYSQIFEHYGKGGPKSDKYGDGGPVGPSGSTASAFTAPLASCSNIDGSDIRKSVAATAECGGSKSYALGRGQVALMQHVGDPSGFLNGQLNNFTQAMKYFSQSLKDIFSGKIWQSVVNSFKSIGCSLGINVGSSCDPPGVKGTIASWKMRTYNRASFAVPEASINGYTEPFRSGETSEDVVVGTGNNESGLPSSMDMLSYTSDPKTFRLITTGEGLTHSYSEYFILASQPYMQTLLNAIAPSAVNGDNIYESQLGYFRFTVPQPSNQNTDFADEATWSSTPKLYGYQDVTDISKSPEITNYALDVEQSMDLDDDRDLSAIACTDPQVYYYCSPSQLGGFPYGNLQNNPDYPKKTQDKYICDGNNQPPLQFPYCAAPAGGGLNTDIRADHFMYSTVGGMNSGPKATLNQINYGQLGCLYSPEWGSVSAPDWSKEDDVKKNGDQWLKNFNAKFKGYLSRSKQGFLKTEDNTQLMKLPCQTNPAQTCYYKYWEMGYQNDKQSQFNLFNTTDGAKGAALIQSNLTYFRKAEGSQPYFAIRAMFEDTSDLDKQVSPLQMPIDGSKMHGPFKFVGFWVTAAAPNTKSSRFIYMRMSAATANSCREVAQVISPKDRKNGAYTDRVWSEGGFSTPQLSYTYGTENSPFGAALHQRMIGSDPMLMLDTTKGIVSADAAFVKPGQQYWTQSKVTNTANSNHMTTYFLLSNLFARIYQVYDYYDLPVGKNDKMCYFGPFVGRRCNNYLDCTGEGTCTNNLCNGGIYNGRECKNPEDCRVLNNKDAVVGTSPDFNTLIQQSCQSVSTNGQAHSWTTSLKFVDTNETFNVGINCVGTKDPVTFNADDPDLDDNRCTHGVGYYPRPDLCQTNPDNIQCLKGVSIGSQPYSYALYSAKMNTPPTDVTQGQYQFDSVDNSWAPIALTGQDSPGNVYTDKFVLKPVLGFHHYFDEQKYVTGNIPHAPRIAAPDTSRQCAAPGQCPIAKLDAINIDNSSEGKVIYFGAQAQVTARFYAWSDDNQAPITDVWVDWGDGSVQKVSDARIKNKKPYCGVAKQCEFAPGLSCNSDVDCPPAAGKCFGTGFCSNDPSRSCRAELKGSNTDCLNSGSCVARLTYGNSPLDCEANYFEFKHSYQCSQVLKPAVDCAINSSVSCFDKSVANVTTDCHFIPRVFVKDNWGWCTGDCSKAVGINNPPKFPKDISFKKGGCYDASKTQLSNSVFAAIPIGSNMCDADASIQNGFKGNTVPWVPFAGYVEMRSGE